MARASVINPFQVFKDSAGLVALADGTVTFYENLTTNLAVIYSDPDLTITQSNPYTLDDGGQIQGDVRFSGTLTLLVKDSIGAEQYTIDNVICYDQSEPFSDWDAATTYGEGGANIVTGSDGNYYVSLTANNLNNDPISDPVNWQQIQFFPGSSTEIDRLAEIGEIVPANQRMIIGDGTAWTSIQLPEVTRNFLGGLVTSNGTDAEHDIDIALGRCNDSTNALSMVITAITKQIDATWATGTGNGGLASGASLGNDTWYHVFIVVVGGVADAMFDTSVTCANGVANNAVTHFRRIGSVLTDGSANIIPYFQNGNYFYWDAIVQDVAASNPGTSAVVPVISTPLGVSVTAGIIGAMISSDATNDTFMLVTSPNQTDIAADNTTYNLLILDVTLDAIAQSALLYVETDTSSQIRYRLANSGGTASVTVNINTTGWIDGRGQ